MNIILAAVWVIGAFCLASQSAAAVDIIRENPQDSRRFEVVSQQLSADGVAYTVVFRTAGGIFACDLDLGDAEFGRLIFVIKDQKFWEGVSFQNGEKTVVDLKEAKGVRIEGAGSDCIITFEPEAVELLRRGGRFQFINQYRG